VIVDSGGAIDANFSATRRLQEDVEHVVDEFEARFLVTFVRSQCGWRTGTAERRFH
jgi:hypothetical protein